MIKKSDLDLNLQAIDQDEFGVLAESYRRELHAHCYRMLGSVQEAEEIVQETLWRGWDRRDTYQGRSTLRAWLYKIATNLCIDALRKKPRRLLPVMRENDSTPEQPIPAAINEPVWLEPYPFEFPGPEEANPESKYSLNESIRLAFLTSLHLLPSRQRAVLILRDVLDWQADEVADALGQTVYSVKSALHRARTTLAKHRETLHHESLNVRVTDEQMREQLDRYVNAWETADVDGLVTLLRDDCIFSMPPIPSWYRGPGNIGALARKTIFRGDASGRWRLLPTRANGQAGFGLYQINKETGVYVGYGIQVVSFIGEQIADITTFKTPELIALFGLPAAL